MFSIKIFTFSPIQENTYLLYNENKEGILIDPGCYYPEEREVLKDFINKESIILKKLLNTHCHLDHIFGNKFIADTYNLPVHLHPDEEIMLQRAPASGLMFNLPFDNYEGKFIYLTEEDKITLGNDKLEIIYTPGHSPGHICFYCREQHFIVSGDVLFLQSIGRTDLPGGDYDTLIKSIKGKIFLLDDEVIVYPGHGNSTTLGNEKRYNPFLGIS